MQPLIISVSRSLIHPCRLMTMHLKMRMTQTARLSRDRSAEASRGDGHHQRYLEQTSGISSISGSWPIMVRPVMRLLLALGLPKVLNELNAEAGHFSFIVKKINSLNALSVSARLITGLVVPADQGLVGRALPAVMPKLSQMPQRQGALSCR